MTVIAWDGKILAADRMVCCNGLKYETTKAFRVPQGLLGLSGTMTDAMSLLHWFMHDDMRPELFPENCKREPNFVNALFVDKDNKCWLYQNTPHGLLVESKFHAIGSGCDFAIAAMYLGATADHAVCVASELSDGCGKGVDILRLEK